MTQLFSPMLAEKMRDRDLTLYNERLNELLYSLDQKKIYNSDHQNLNQDLGRLINSYFSNVIRDKINISKIHNDIVLDLYYKSVMSFHDIISAKKKVEKIKIEDFNDFNDDEQKYVKVYQKLCNELIETALMLKEIKQYIIKGRKPSNNSSTKVENENKVIETCSCCFRKIAINKKGEIAHHGFQRQGGYQSESCFGQGYESWERSDKGTKTYIKFLEDVKSKNENRLKLLPEQDSLIALINGRITTVKKGNDNFKYAYNSTQRELNSENRSCEIKIKYLNEKLDNRK